MKVKNKFPLGLKILFLACFASSCMKINKKGESNSEPSSSSVGSETPTQTQNPPPTPSISTTLPTEKQPPVAAQSELEIFREKNFDFEYINAKDDPKRIDIEKTGQEAVRFYFPKIWPTSMVVEKNTMTGVRIFQREIQPTDRTWIDNAPLDNQKFNYKFYEMKSGALKLLKEIEILPALDISLAPDEKLNLAEKFNLNPKVERILFRQLELKSNAKIFVGEYRGSIVIESLISEGLIQTFPQEARATQQNGRNAGGFSLKILNGSGFLRVNLVAESGGNGKSGAAPDAALTGETGQAGNLATYRTERIPCTNSQQCLFDENLLYCVQPPTDGYPGRQGKQGYQGSPGFDGGSVEKILLVNLAPQMRVDVLRLAGQRGFGGSGGDGGKGGDGGNAGAHFRKGEGPGFATHIKEGCKDGVQGPEGARGPQGLPGPDGRDGRIFN